MGELTDAFIKRHWAYLKNHPEEIQQYDSIYEHMLYYFTNKLGAPTNEAHEHIAEFRSSIEIE
ncbi:hypothetical protein EBB07_02665 [Paenibacillaceae bacterium]|nr:hypothetical protein EBB07_02665 [Paenibacillaceae bacterium]